MKSQLVRVIVNPASAGGRGGKVTPALLEALDRAGIDHEACYTSAAGHAVSLSDDAARDGVGRVVVVGGDGTVHEVATGLLRSEVQPPPAMAVYPVGTGNDFYRMVGAGKSVSDVVDVLQAGVVRHFDVGVVAWADGEAYFVNLLGLGVDVEVLRRRDRFSRLGGLPQYLAALVSAIVSFEPPSVDIEIGPLRLSGKTTLSAITVGPSVGGGFMLAPGATPADGLLDLCHFPQMGLWKILRLVPRVLRGTHGTLEGVTTHRFEEEAVLRSPDGELLWFELDGELAPQPAAELRVRVMPGVLPVLVPADA